MRRFASLSLIGFAIGACQPISSPVHPEPMIQKAARVEAVPLKIAPSAPSLVSKNIHGIEFEGVEFDARSHQLLVVDQPQGPGSLYLSSQDVAQKHSALLAINAGFFTPEGTPLGLLVSHGKRSGAWNFSSSLGSGFFAETRDGQLSIRRRSANQSADGISELIQAGPLLVENGRGIQGLDPEKQALRSFILTDGGRRWWIGKTSLCSLSALGKALDASSPCSWSVRHALNLDGGRSTDLYVSPRISGGPINRRTFLNRPVRNFLILKSRT
jgi:Phosphodiester glycosidase